MSPTIRSKGGQPLFVGGLVAGADKCCDCGTESCGCPDFCAYQIAVISPADRAVASGFDCTSSGAYAYSPSPIIGSVLDGVDGILCDPQYGIFSACGGWGQVQSLALWSPPTEQLTADVVVSASKTVSVGSSIGHVVSVYVRVFVSVRCSSAGGMVYDPIAARPYGIDLAITTVVGISKTKYNAETNDSGAQVEYEYSSTSVKHVNIGQDSCSVAGQQSCGVVTVPSAKVLKISLPSDFSASPSTTSLGEYDSVEVSQSGPVPSSIISAINALPDIATFRITSRPSCRTKTCSCGYAIYGTSWNFVGREYVWGTPDEEWNDDSGQHWLWNGAGTLVYENYLSPGDGGPVDGDGHPYRILSRERVDVYCSYVDGEPKWIVLLRATCWGYDEYGANTKFAEDTWLGELLCYEACSDDWHDQGDPIPTGSPQLVIYQGRENSGLADCSTGGQPTVLVGQIATC